MTDRNTSKHYNSSSVIEGQAARAIAEQMIANAIRLWLIAVTRKGLGKTIAG
jgi:hypothetical protein